MKQITRRTSGAAECLIILNNKKLDPAASLRRGAEYLGCLFFQYGEITDAKLG
jgi:hypothetical protein